MTRLEVINKLKIQYPLLNVNDFINDIYNLISNDLSDEDLKIVFEETCADNFAKYISSDKVYFISDYLIVVIYSQYEYSVFTINLLVSFMQMESVCELFGDEMPDIVRKLKDIEIGLVSDRMGSLKEILVKLEKNTMSSIDTLNSINELTSLEDQINIMFKLRTCEALSRLSIERADFEEFLFNLRIDQVKLIDIMFDGNKIPYVYIGYENNSPYLSIIDLQKTDWDKKDIIYKNFTISYSKLLKLSEKQTIVFEINKRDLIWGINKCNITGFNKYSVIRNKIMDFIGEGIY